MCVNEKETGVIAKADDHSHQQTVHMRGKKRACKQGGAGGDEHQGDL